MRDKPTLSCANLNKGDRKEGGLLPRFGRLKVESLNSWYGVILPLTTRAGNVILVFKKYFICIEQVGVL